jgi:hypothetical protein
MACGRMLRPDRSDGTNAVWYFLKDAVNGWYAAQIADDRTQYYDPTNPQGSVMNPNTGTQLRILGITGTLGGFMQLEVRPAR